MASPPPEQSAPAGARDPVHARMQRLLDQGQRVVAMVMARRAGAGAALHPDPLNIGGAFARFGRSVLLHPRRVARANVEFARDWASLAGHAARRALGRPADAVIEPARGDRRFQDAAWTDQWGFDVLKQGYLLTARHAERLLRVADGLDPADAMKVDFFTRQILNALAPTNFPLTNPAVLRETMETRGDNLLRGMENLLADLEAGGGSLRVRVTDEAAFAPGRNLAITPGKVVARSDLCELLMYEPTTPTVHRTPVLLVPPWINKFYVLDLRPENSLVRWLVAQGHTVFVLSWVNPSEEHAGKTFDHYLVEGPLAALATIADITGETEAHAVGYCLGGTLLATTAAWLAAREKRGLASITCLTTLTDFSEVGELAMFVEREQLDALDEKMRRRGYLKGEEMSFPFNLMRSNDLVWSHVVNNYLLGRQPFPFDMLYWASDSTRMPAAMHSFYLRAMYLENRLRTPGGITLAGVPLDLSRVKVPAYMVSTQEDHIAPWRSTHRAVDLLGGPVQFTLGGSGHIAGVINPPTPGKYGFRTAPGVRGQGAETWLASAAEHKGSWWPHWLQWLESHREGRVPARAVPDKGLGHAPGAYALVRERDLPQAW